MRFWNTMVLSFLIVGCSAKKAKLGAAAANAAVLEKNWIDNPPSDACAVGSAPLSPGMSSMARTASASAARAELARQIKTKIEGMVKTYQSVEMAGKKGVSEQKITNINTDIVNMEIPGSKIRATKERNGELHALVCIDPESMQEAIGKMNSMSESMRSAISSRMNDELKDLDARIERSSQ
jgi:hypothetical protein